MTTPSILDLESPADQHGEVDKTSRPRSLPGWMRPRTWLPPLGALGLLVLVWQLVALHNRFVLPTVQQVLGELGGHPGLFWDSLLVTLQEAVVGALFGMVAAFILALSMCEVRLIERAFMPLAVALNVTPVIAIAPGLVVAFGFGMTPKYIVTAVIVFFPFLINALIGLRSVDSETYEVLTTLHASRREILLRLRLPGSLPYLFAAARICMPLSLVGAVVAEFSAAGKASGLGSLIETAASLSDLKTVYASVLVLGLLGVALTLGVVLVQRSVLGWQRTTSPRR